jgi:protease I
MSSELSGKNIAILVADGFEEVELTQPQKALMEAGANTVIVSPAKGKVKAWKTTDWGIELPVGQPLSAAKVSDFDALLLPGGVMNPDKLRLIPDAVRFVRAFFDEGKPIAAICHGPWTLIEAGIVDGRTLTSWPSLKTDIVNAGGMWEDRDDGLITSRNPDDIPAFNERMIEEFAEGVRQDREMAGLAR